MTSTRTLRRLAAAFCFAIAAAPCAAAVDVLHAFNGSLNGVSPQSPILVSGGALFGTTLEGGASTGGTVFRLSTNGAGFISLHSFDAISDPLGEGTFPSGRLSEIDGWLYGTTEFGGAAFDGVIYRIDKNGSTYETVHDFDMDSAPAASPSGGVTTDGSSLFGSSLFGSAVSEGAIYTVTTEGSGFDVLRELASNGSEGEEISGPLVLQSEILWGVASFGGTHDGGTLFSYDLNADTLTVLHHFGDGDDGSVPVGGLMLNGGTLYGVTEQGGGSGLGTVFSIAVNGTGYQTLHDFTGGDFDGASPVGGLTLVGDKLFGVTREAGPSDLGAVFSMSTSGAGYELRHAFSGGDGATPLAGLTYDGQTLYGTTSEGGLGGGVVYSIDPQAVRGDYNGDGVVDAADYTVWRDTLGSTSQLAADGDFSGTVNQADFDVWANRYGDTASAFGVAAPEPTGTALCFAAVAALATIPRR